VQGSSRSRHLLTGTLEAPTEERQARFEALYAELMPRVLGYALRRTEAEEARDVVAETFTVAWRRLDEVPDGAAALPWLLVTARNVLANRRRKADREPAIAPTVAVRDHADDVAATLALGSAFARLSERDRETLALVAWDALPPRDAARVAGCSAATFTVRLHRARRRLAALLSETDGTPMAQTTEESA
jgi:RNA polymerase sigma factor (sigma-70 family)